MNSTHQASAHLIQTLCPDSSAHCHGRSLGDAKRELTGDNPVTNKPLSICEIGEELASRQAPHRTSASDRLIRRGLSVQYRRYGTRYLRAYRRTGWRTGWYVRGQTSPRNHQAQALLLGGGGGGGCVCERRERGRTVWWRVLAL